MNIIHPGPVYICEYCRCLIAGHATEKKDIQGELGSNVEIAAGFTCPKCEEFNELARFKHPDVTERETRQKIRQELENKNFLKELDEQNFKRSLLLKH